MSVTKEQAIAYTEVLEILKYVEREYIDRIPQKLIKYYEQNKDCNYKFSLDRNKSFEEQKLTEKTKIVLAILFKEYLATETQKEKIRRKQAYDLRIIENEKKKKYDYDNLFKPKKVATEEHSTLEENRLIEYKKEKWYTKFFHFIKRLLKHF